MEGLNNKTQDRIGKFVFTIMTPNKQNKRALNKMPGDNKDKCAHMLYTRYNLDY